MSTKISMHKCSAGYVTRERRKAAVLKRAAQNYAKHMMHYMDGKNIAYGISVCPDTGRQFLVELGKDNNICELTPTMVDTIRKAAWIKGART